MMKQEFEQLIGKEVSYETFRLYEEMYLAAPESVTKQKFVEMLNIDAIPESEDAIERRQRAEARRQELQSQIAEERVRLHDLQDSRKRYAQWGKEEENSEYWRRQARWYKELIKKQQARIAEMKFLMA